MSQIEKEFRYNLYRGGFYWELKNYTITRSKQK